MPALSVVIPAYNEEDGIADIVERVLSVKTPLTEAGVQEMELIVVDDGSSDRTAEIVASYPQVRLIRHARNKGYGAALKTGFHQAKGDLLAFLDADGTYPPEFFPQLCQTAIQQEADLVIGSRMAGEDSQMPLTRRVGNFFFANLISLISNERISDSASGMRVLRREALPHLYPLPDGLNFTPVMSTRALHEGIRMVEVPITYSERAGRSKLSVVRDGARFLNSIIWTAMNYNPVRILGGAGAAAMGLAVIIVAVLVIMRLQGITTLGPWGVFGLFTAGVALVAGVSIFSLGATFNYLVTLFHRRPIRQGLLGQPLFKTPLEKHFGWVGLLALLGGLTLSTGALVLGLTGWDISRLWFWMVSSAMIVLMGLQLLISWFVMQVLAKLSLRDTLVEDDMNGYPTK
ncbi:MAG: glycosyltransferase family 2 protein [Anaerolineae bacterium]|nr:MAG: glycosyltransferase family 2 protein [Anaerolineae bacterium]